MAELIAPTRFQKTVLRYRGTCGLVNAGGRGSGKSFSLILDLLDHCREFGAEARPLVTRESHGGLLELQTEIHELATVAFGLGVSRNKQENAVYLPTGGIVYFSNLGDDASYAKLQGRTFTGLYADEAGNYPPQGFAFLRRAMSNLRVAPGKRPWIHLTCNPHGRSHATILREFVSKAPPWHPFQDEHGLWWVWTTSTLEDNPHIDRETYRRNLLASCGNDQALADAWLRGDWSVLGGVMFANFDPATHVIRAAYLEAQHVIGGDWGRAAPAVGILLARLKAPVGYLRAGDVVAVDETDTADPTDLSVGLGHPPQMFAEMLKEMANRNGVRCPFVVMDDARGLQSDTVIGLLRENGIGATKPCRKDRVGTWALINQLLHNAKTGEGGPGLFFTDRCAHLLETLPEAPRGTLRPEDVDPKWNRDHWLDALGYGVRELHRPRVRSGRVVGV